MDPYAPISADGSLLTVGDVVTFGGRALARFRKATVVALDGPHVWLEMTRSTGQVLRVPIPAGWVSKG